MSTKGQIVWVHGYPCSGKTFMADYLSMLEWQNIDGDWKSESKDPKIIKEWADLLRLSAKLGAGIPLTEDEEKLKKSHISELCDKALDVASQGKNACISFLLHQIYYRNFIKEIIPDIKIIHIQVDLEVLLEKNFIRITNALKPATLEQGWHANTRKLINKEKYGNEYSKEVFNQWFADFFYQGLEPHEESEKNCFTIRNSKYEKAGVAHLREICGITGDFDYDVEKIEAIQKARYAKSDFVKFNKERTFIMIKPDGVQRGLIGKIIARFEEKGFKLAAMKVCQPGKQHLEKHYADLAGKKFFPGLIEYMNSGPVCAMVWQGDNAVSTGRKMLGATKPFDSEPGTIRGDFCIDVGRNICHGSDAIESAQNEIDLWFKPEEVLAYKQHSFDWIYE